MRTTTGILLLALAITATGCEDEAASDGSPDAAPGAGGMGGDPGMGGISGDTDDLFVCTPSALGATTTCSYAFYWDAAAAGFGSSIDGFAIMR